MLVTPFATLLDEVRNSTVDRIVIGIAGAPGAGKSTLAHRLAAELDDVVVVPMDGFHLANVQLQRLGRADRKGAPDTFDAAGYAALLRRLRTPTSDIVYAPAFDHVMNEPIAGSIAVPPKTRVVITEGNYLLLWDEVRALLDVTVYLEADDAPRVAGLVARQRDKGLSSVDAVEWVMRSDEANARLVKTTADRAQLRLARDGAALDGPAAGS